MSLLDDYQRMIQGQGRSQAVPILTGMPRGISPTPAGARTGTGLIEQTYDLGAYVGARQSGEAVASPSGQSSTLDISQSPMSQGPQSLQTMGFQQPTALDSTMQYVKGAGAVGNVVGGGISAAKFYDVSSPELDALGSGIGQGGTYLGYAGLVADAATGRYDRVASKLVTGPGLNALSAYSAQAATTSAIASNAGMTVAEYSALPVAQQTALAASWSGAGAIAGSGYGAASMAATTGLPAGLTTTGVIQGSGYAAAGGIPAGATAGTSAGFAGVGGLSLGPVAAGAGIGSLIGGQFGGTKNDRALGSVAGGAIGGGITGGIMAGAMAGTAAMSWSGPGAIIGAVVGAIIGGVSAILSSWICTEIDKAKPLSETENEALSKLRRYAIKNHKEDARAYLKNGYLLIQNSSLDLDSLKIELVDKCCELVNEGKMKEAFEHYKKVVIDLCKENDFDVRELYQEVRHG